MQANELITKQDLIDFEDRITRKIEQVLSKGIPAKDAWLSSEQVQKIFGDLPRSTLKGWRDSGKIKYRRVGQRIFHDPQSVEDLLNKN